jgi:hypothetical protein
MALQTAEAGRRQYGQKSLRVILKIKTASSPAELVL